MKYFIKIVSLIGILVISQITYSGSINDDFKTGDTLTATHLNNAKEAVNDNDDRITTLEGTTGKTGPQGIQGIPGIDGADGATGPQGPPGEGFGTGIDIAVDCNANSGALINTTLKSGNTYVFTCLG